MSTPAARAAEQGRRVWWTNRLRRNLSRPGGAGPLPVTALAAACALLLRILAFDGGAGDKQDQAAVERPVEAIVTAAPRPLQFDPMILAAEPAAGPEQPPAEDRDPTPRAPAPPVPATQARLVPERAAGTTTPVNAAVIPAEPTASVPSGRASLRELLSENGSPDLLLIEDLIAELRAKELALAEREAAMSTREAALVTVVEQLESRESRLETMRDELEKLSHAVADQDAAELVKLVKVYESMKAKKAAEVFDRLELGVLLDLARRMRDTKLAAILAYMEPGKAKVLTAALAAPTVAGES